MRATLGRWLAAAVAVLAIAGTASAEMIAGIKAEGEMEAGARFFFEEPTDSRRGKFEEYRDIPEGLFLDRFRLRLFTPEEDYSVQLDGSKWGQQDQEFGLRGGRLGLWEFGFEWDQMRHIFSTTSQQLAVEQPKGVFTLPTPRPLLPTYNSAPGLDEISVRWDTARINLMFTPTPNLEFRAEYTRIDKHGDRPFSMAYGSSANNFMEFAAPIDETVTDFRLKGTLAYDRWQLQAAYTFSMYQNHLTSVTADNPCFGLTAAIAAGGCAGDATGAPSAGRVSLAPNNMAHAVNLAGGVTLPFWNTRLTANVGYSVQLQNDTFLPHTINPAISSPALTLPENSLDGLVGIFLVNFNVITRPLRPLTLSLKYRLFDRNDMSNELDFPGHVVNDRTLVVGDQVASRPDYTRQNLDLDGRWRFGQPAALTIGGGWERWDRSSNREVPTSDEYFGKAALDLTPVDWLLARLSYRPSFRRISDYNTFAPALHTAPDTDPSTLALGQSTLLRKFDEGERNRQQVSGMLQLTPLDGFTTSLTGDYRYDDYIDSTLGLQQATSWSAGIDLNWTPVERLSVFGGYTYERIFQKQRSRFRTIQDFPDFDWITDNTDTINTIYAGAKVGLIPRVLDWTVNASYAYALGRMQTRNPVAPTSGTAAQDATATAQPFPAFEDQLLRVETALRYHFWKAWTASFGYVFESFQKNDWRTDRLDPFIPGVTSIWLGDDARNYDAHWVTATLAYRF